MTTACHDPYRELELYLEAAQEEIGKAIKELEQHEEISQADPCTDENVFSGWNNSVPGDNLLPPPKAFRSKTLLEKGDFVPTNINNCSPATVKRVCHDGNIVDFKSSEKRCLDNICSPKAPFSSSLSPGSLGRYKNSTYSPNTRRRLWQMHPSLSFPETSKDLDLLGKNAEYLRILEKNAEHSSKATDTQKLSNGCLLDSLLISEKSRTLSNEERKMRQRSNSETSAPHILCDGREDNFVIPRPPSGDVNLLSIWANNLVLELDKSFSGELNSASSYSPSSDYSLSPTKPDELLEASNSNLSQFEGTHNQKGHPVDASQLSLPERDIKLVSMSPDSGIEQASCDTPEISEDCVDSSVTSGRKMNDMNCDASSGQELDIITPPPPEFGDEKNVKDLREVQNTSLYKQANEDDERPQNLNAAVPICEIHETSEILENTNDINTLPRAVASESVELEDWPIVRTTCILSTISPENGTKRKVTPEAVSFQERNKSSLTSSRDNRLFSSLPKQQRIFPNGLDKWSGSLPRYPGKVPDPVFPQRSSSQSAVSTICQVSIDELADFMRRMKTTSYQSPSCADVSTDVKDDNENKDAVTQTSPVPLSRSSSFTWVTECDCSDWDSHNFNSGSEDSLLMASCSNCNAENKNNKSSSSSSLGISSDDDEGQPTTPGSGNSSLYLSACSGSSDSFDEACITVTNEDASSELVTFSENGLFNACRRPLRSSEITLRGSALGDISEEQVTSDTVSVKSNISNPSLLDSNNVDAIGQSASFPSTLKVTRKNKSTSSPAQPIEPTVLIINELNLKSVSAPVLLRQKRHSSNNKVPESSSSDSSPPTGTRSKDSLNVPNQAPARAHSAKELNELQAIEACSWLRAAGFPQYAQMYEDNQFPIDICIVQKDHAFLPPDSIQSLFRRLNTLNRCAKMKFVDHAPRKSIRMEESDDEEQYALSENWEFQRSSRRWSRIPATSDGIADYIPSDPPSSTKSSGPLYTHPARKYLSPEEVYCSSHDSVFIDEQHSSPDSIRRSTVLKSERISVSPTGHVDCSPGSSSGSGGTLSLTSEDLQERRNLRRSGSDRVKEGAKALLKRMESLKGKRKKKVVESNKVENHAATHSGTDGSSSSSVTSSPQFHRSQRATDSSRDSNLQTSLKKESGGNLSKGGDDVNSHSDSECRMFLVSHKWKDANSNNTKHFKAHLKSQTSVTITTASDDLSVNPSIGERKSHSLHKRDPQQKKNLLHPGSSVAQEWEDYDKRGSYYDNLTAPLVVFNDLCAESLDRSVKQTKFGKPGSFHSSFTDRDSMQNQDDGEIIIINNERRDSGVGSSLTRGITYQQAPWHCFPAHHPSETKAIPCPTQITELTAPQMLLLRKLSLLKLTTVMEKFSPSSRTGWSWAVPKFIRRIRNPDYKDKVVFGVPLLLILQRTGQPLPVSIQAAIHYLRKTALDSTGLFRKSGVRSRIQKLKSLNESNPEKISYEDQQAYDVADMLKQYFRELPEALLTNKLSETFISIFQYIPEDLRLEAIQAALMLMPDENREVLQALLEFLQEVCQHSGVNQMTATNLAVCFAPSLFHLSTPRSASSSPRRRKTVGVPDLRELNENRAAYECLSCMVSNYKVLFSVSEEMVSQSRISSATHSQPSTLEELSSIVCNDQGGLKGYVDSCIQVFLKEAREKYKGWINVCQYDHVDLTYKKVADGHPLRLWKVSTEVEAPPVEVLNRILRERHLWDTSFSKWKVVSRLNNQTEIFQYLSSSLPPHPPCDYCVMRSWRTDLPKGTCVLIETSVNHSEAEVIPGSVRGLILASRYFIEHCGSGKSRVTYISRVDTRGRSPEWYNRAYGHICTLQMIKLRNSFSRTRTDGPETKV